MQITLGKTFSLPAWAEQFIQTKAQSVFQTDEEMVQLAIEAAALNVNNRTGGPFGAAVFTAGGRLVSIGVNIVEPERCSVFHAEVVALMLAQQTVGRYSLGTSPDGERFVLAASAAPCVMCFGAIHWSGVSRLICSATKADVEVIGFDEGPIPDDWAKRLNRGGTEVVEGCKRASGQDVLKLYSAAGLTIYNPGQSKS